MTEPEFTKIIHPTTGNIAEVPVSSLGFHYAAGWAPLDESPEPEPRAPDPVRAKKPAKNEKEGE
jgi:hypothetical protein